MMSKTGLRGVAGVWRNNMEKAGRIRPFVFKP